MTSKIAWTDRTWNPVRGCSRVSEGCRHCYAERMAARNLPEMRSPTTGKPFATMKLMEEHFRNHRPRFEPRWTGRVELIPEKLDEPLHWRKPRRVFVTSMSDVFHETLPDSARDQIFAVVAMCQQHTFQNLTKRPENQRRYTSDPETPFRIQRQMDAIGVDLEMRGVAEEWRPVVGWTKYEVSNYGNVRRDKNLIQAKHPGGYRQVGLCENGEPKTQLVHMLVLEAFRSSARDGEEARHRNGDRSDNRLANLSWGSKADNMDDASRHGTAGIWMKERATLTPDQISEIRRRRSGGEKLDDIAAAVGSNRQQVSAVALLKIFKPASLTWPLANLHLGVSVEDRASLHRLDSLRATTPAVRWVSFEPLLDHLGTVDLRGIDWVVTGGETGPGARVIHPDAFRSIRDQCVEADVPFFFKSRGGSRKAKDHDQLDGREWKEFPR